MAVSAIGAGAMFAFRAATGVGIASPSERQTQVNMQADLLQALMGARLPAMAAAHLSDGLGVDLYM
jgi:hypothetical protein